MVSNNPSVFGTQYGSGTGTTSFAAKSRAFSGQNNFGDVFTKRRRLREWITKNSQYFKRENQKIVDKIKKKHKQKEDHKEIKKIFREIDGEEMFFDETEELEITEEQLAEIEENRNPTPKRCIIINNKNDNIMNYKK